MIGAPPAGTLAGEALRAAAVAAAALALLVATEAVYRRFRPPAETTRKAVHVGGGLLAMAFPWLFAWPVSVVVLGLAMGAIIGLGGRLGLLESVTGVERRSRGQIYHPIAVVALFLLAHRQPVFYVISLWTLVMADAAAALMGKRYGRLTYEVHGERKSIEGSAAFFLVAFLGIHLPLLLFTGISREASFVVSLQLALLVTCFEAIGMHGNDNLIVPLGTYYLLHKLTPAPAPAIVIQLAVQLALFGLAIAVAWRTRFLSFAGAVAAHLVLYGAFSLGGPGWITAPALAFAGFALLERRVAHAAAPPEASHQVRSVFYVSLVAVALLAADNSFATFIGPRHPLGSGHPFFVPFVAALAAHFAIAVLRVLRGWRPATTPAAAGTPAAHVVLAVVIGFAVVAPASLALEPAGRTAASFVLALGICAVATLVYAVARGRAGLWVDDPWGLRGQAVAVAIAVAASLPIVLASVGRP